MWKKIILVFFVLSILSILVGCGGTTTPPVYPDGNLSAPTGVSASDGTYTDKIYITWNSVSGASYYKLYRATSATGTKTAVTNWESSTTEYDYSVTPGTTYYYWVKAATSSSGANASAYSSYNTGYAKITLLAPAGVSASDGTYTDRVYTTWNSVTGATHYQVYRATSASGTKTVITSWQTTRSYYDYDVTPGTTYYYWVKAATSSSGANASAYSSYNTGYAKITLLAPTGVDASEGIYSNMVEISWNPVSGANYYKLFRSTSSTGTKIELSDWFSDDDTTVYDFNVTTGEFYYYWVKAATSSSGANASPYSSYDIGYAKMPLSAPTGVSASDGTYTDKVYISWNSVTGASYYQVYRATSASGTKTAITSWQTTRSDYDYSVTPGTTYYYFVKAATSSSGANASAYSSYNTGYAKLPDTTLSAPTGVSASDGTYTDRVYTTWNSVTGASYYQVYRATSASGTKTAITSWQTARSDYDYSVTPGTTYYYWVKAATSSSGANASAYSSYNTGYAKLPDTTLSAPTGVSASDGTYTDKVYISWNSVTGASYYQVYRATSASGTKTAITSWQTTRSDYDYSVTPGTTYYYFVKAATSSSGANASPYSSYNTGYAKLPDTTLSAPTGVSASDGTYTDRVYTTWNSVTGASYYQVYRATSASGTKTAITSWQTARSDYDYSVTPGTTYYYFVRAATSSSGANASAYSSYNTGYAKLPDTTLSAPTGVSASDGTYTDRVYTTWNSVTGASYYQVYRATSASGTKTAITSWQTARSDYDYSVTPGTTYYYFVRAATSSSGANASAYSSYNTGYAKLPDTTLSAPTGVSASDGTYTDYVYTTWNSVTGASYYQVYRATSTSGTKIAITSWQSHRYDADYDATPGTTYYYFVRAATSSSGANASPYSSYNTGYAKLPDTTLSAPTGLWASDGTYENKIYTSWSSVSGASYYRVYKATSSSGTKTPVTSWQTDRYDYDYDVTPNITYYYWVKAATDGSGANDSDYSSYDTGYAETTTLSAPTGLDASDGTYTDRIYTTWNSVTGASYYRVYKATSSGGTKTAVTDWQTTRSDFDYDIIPGTTYYYFVKAATSSSGANASPYSSYNTGYAETITLSAPNGVYASDGTYEDKVYIRWDSVSGAWYYKLYKATSATGTKTAVTDWETDCGEYDYDVTPNTIYYYFVKAATSSTGANASPYSSYNTGYAETITLSAPTGLDANWSLWTGNIMVTWNEVSGASYYKVYRARLVELPKVAITGWQLSTYYEDDDVDMGDIFFYWVRAATSSTGANASDYSDPAGAQAVW